MGLNEKNDNGNTALIWAVRERQKEIALALIEKSAKLDETDDSSYNEFVWIQRLKEEREDNRAKKIKVPQTIIFSSQLTRVMTQTWVKMRRRQIKWISIHKQLRFIEKNLCDGLITARHCRVNAQVTLACFYSRLFLTPPMQRTQIIMRLLLTLLCCQGTHIYKNARLFMRLYPFLDESRRYFRQILSLKNHCCALRRRLHCFSDCPLSLSRQHLSQTQN